MYLFLFSLNQTLNKPHPTPSSHPAVSLPCMPFLLPLLHFSFFSPLKTSNSHSMRNRHGCWSSPYQSLSFSIHTKQKVCYYHSRMNIYAYVARFYLVFSLDFDVNFDFPDKWWALWMETASFTEARLGREVWFPRIWWFLFTVQPSSIRLRPRQTVASRIIFRLRGSGRGMSPWWCPSPETSPFSARTFLCRSNSSSWRLTDSFLNMYGYEYI